MMKALKRPFIELNNEKEAAYGGAQQWFLKNYLKSCGCGVIACANIIAHKMPGLIEGCASERDAYMKLAERLRRFYLPVIPGQGINGLVMSLGINVFFVVNRPHG